MRCVLGSRSFLPSSCVHAELVLLETDPVSTHAGMFFCKIHMDDQRSTVQTTTDSLR